MGKLYLFLPTGGGVIKHTAADTTRCMHILHLITAYFRRQFFWGQWGESSSLSNFVITSSSLIDNLADYLLVSSSAGRSKRCRQVTYFCIFSQCLILSILTHFITRSQVLSFYISIDLRLKHIGFYIVNKANEITMA